MLVSAEERESMTTSKIYMLRSFNRQSGSQGR